MERAQSSPPGGDGAERNFFRRNGGCIAPAPKGLLTSPPARAPPGPAQSAKSQDLFRSGGAFQIFMHPITPMGACIANIPVLY